MSKKRKLTKRERRILKRKAAKTNAPEGIEGMMQSIFGGLFSGMKNSIDGECPDCADGQDSMAGLNDMLNFDEIMPGLDRKIQYKESVKILLAHPEATIPEYATDGSSGVDLKTVEDLEIAPYGVDKVSTGIKMAIPTGLEFQIRPRSGNSLKLPFIVANSPGTIDCDYRGIIHIIIRNLSSQTLRIVKGTKIAQGVLCPVFKAEFHQVEKDEDLEETERGDGGFGSTDKTQESQENSTPATNKAPDNPQNSLKEKEESTKIKKNECN